MRAIRKYLGFNGGIYCIMSDTIPLVTMVWEKASLGRTKQKHNNTPSWMVMLPRADLRRKMIGVNQFEKKTICANQTT